MMCLKPVRINEDTEYPCGRCTACLQKRSAEWALRLRHEAITHKKTMFMTLTYSDENLPENGGLCKKDVQDFLKLFRYYLGRKIKYFAVGEYGEEKGRPHYHLLIFGAGKESQVHAEKAWKKGIVDIGECEPASIRYVTNYLMTKEDKWSKVKGVEKPFQLQSQGLGSEWLCRNGEQYSRNMFITTDNGEINLPRYYIKKLNLSEEQKTERKLEIIERRLIAFKNVYGRLPDKEIREGLIDEWRYLEQKRLNLKAKIQLYRSKRNGI